VRVGISAGTSTKLLPLVLEAIAKQSPDVEIRLEALSSAVSIQRIQNGTLDIGIVAGEHFTNDAGVHVKPWRQDSLVALLPNDWALPEFVTPHWLSERRWSSFAPATQMHGLIARWFGQAGCIPKPYLSLSYPGALKSLAIASHSAALLPFEEVEDLKQIPNVFIRPLEPQLMRPMALAYRQLKEPQIAVHSVLRVLEQFANYSEDCCK
jgi:DNA-binding transcriptional LysR family regulator